MTSTCEVRPIVDEEKSGVGGKGIEDEKRLEMVKKSQEIVFNNFGMKSAVETCKISREHLNNL